MLELASIVLLVIYGAALFYILIYSLFQLTLVVSYIRRDKEKDGSSVSKYVPMVTVQLPIYNEKYVIERLIDAVCAFDWPRDKMQIQILDDSTDNTVDVVADKVEFLKNSGVNIQQVKRKDRVGFKAGALKHGLETSSGEFIAIFDADFIPEPSFLKQTICCFENNPGMGVVQSRWGHVNKDYSVLTKTQAFALDAHFTVEQVGRNTNGHFINFNGTGGVWRKSCIIDAGNWESDTLTEDLDLSYRAQLKGWKFKYLEELESPAELPATMGALKSQQFRWTKGGAESAKKNLGKVLRSKLPLKTKMHGAAHLLNSTIFIAVLLTAVFSVPALLVKNHFEHLQLFFKIASFFLVSLLILSVYYAQSYFALRAFNFKNVIRFVSSFPIFLSLSMGLSLHNSVAVFEGIVGKKSPFIRTPKFNIVSKSDGWKKNVYRVKGMSPLAYLEALLAFYFAGGVFLGAFFGDFNLILFHSMLSFGFGAIAYFSFRHAQFG